MFERVIEKLSRKHLEHNGFLRKCQSDFRKTKSAHDNVFRPSQTVMESFNRHERVIALFLDVEKAFDNVWHNELRYKIFQRALPTEVTRWLSDFLAGRVIHVEVADSFLVSKIYPKAAVPHGWLSSTGEQRWAPPSSNLLPPTSETFAPLTFGPKTI